MEQGEDFPQKNLTEVIIGCAFAVHNQLGSGFVEKVYENGLAAELRRRGHKVDQQKPVSVSLKGESVGEFVADMVVDDAVLVELKAIKTILKEHEAKLIHYLKATGIEVGLLLNFSTSVQVRRKINTLPIK
jgi:GxxExxY protein